jgi:hypothetical protein
MINKMLGKKVYQKILNLNQQNDDIEVRYGKNKD